MGNNGSVKNGILITGVAVLGALAGAGIGAGVAIAIVKGTGIVVAKAKTVGYVCTAVGAVAGAAVGGICGNIVSDISLR